MTMVSDVEPVNVGLAMANLRKILQPTTTKLVRCILITCRGITLTTALPTASIQ